MNAIVFDRYGSPDVLAQKDIEVPAPQGDEVLHEVADAIRFVEAGHATGKVVIAVANTEVPGQTPVMEPTTSLVAAVSAAIPTSPGASTPRA